MKQLNWIERQDAMKELNMDRKTFMEYTKGLSFSQKPDSRIATMKGSGYPMNDRPPVIEPEDIKPGKFINY